jgi:ABC-type glutathione transport system ATPase component
MKNLLKMKNLVIEGFTDEKWIEIVHGIDLTLERGEVLGLIGESGAGKSTIGMASMGYTRQGCRIASGSIVFDGTELGPRQAYRLCCPECRGFLQSGPPADKTVCRGAGQTRADEFCRGGPKRR